MLNGASLAWYAGLVKNFLALWDFARKTPLYLPTATRNSKELFFQAIGKGNAHLAVEFNIFAIA